MIKLAQEITYKFLEKEYIYNKKSTRQIAKEVKCSAPTILNYLKKYNIKVRDNSECKLGIKFSKEHKRKISIGHLGINSGSNHYNWKNGRVNQREYVLIRSLEHPNKNSRSYVFEHRLVMEKYIGRYLLPEEVVHHKGIKYPINDIRNRSDNRIKNL